MAEADRKTSGLKAKDLLEALEKRALLPDTEDLLSAIIAQFGGVHEFAKEYFQAYAGTKQSPMVRGKMLDSIMRLINTVNDKRKQTDLELMSTDELESLVSELLSRRQEKQNAGGTETKEESSAKEETRPAAKAK